MPEQLLIDWDAIELQKSTEPLRRAYSYRLDPTRDQDEALHTKRRAACNLYNAMIEERLAASGWRRVGYRKITKYIKPDGKVIKGYRVRRYLRSGPSVTRTTQSAQIKALKADGTLGPLHTDIAYDLVRRIDEAFQSYWKRRRQGLPHDEAGYPNFQSAYRFESFTYRREGPNCRVRENGRLYVDGVGELRVQWHRPLDGEVKTITFKWDGKHWDVIFSCAVSRPVLPPSQKSIGLDLGLRTHAARSDRDEEHPNIEPLKAYAKALRTLVRLQRELDRRTKTDALGRILPHQTKRRNKTKALLRAAHARVARQRQAFQHRETRKLVEEYGLIAIEDLNLTGLSRGMLAKDVADASWGGFIQKLEEKVEETGRRLVRVNPAGTSQTCVCGASVPKDLSIRWHICPACGLSMDRDEVSAKVILQRALSK